MKKICLLIAIFGLSSFTFADEFPAFPMTLYGNVKIWTTDLAWWTLSVYNSSNTQIASYTITESWKYGSTNVWVVAFVVNSFDWNLTFKATYNSKTYVVDAIDDTSKWDWCPSKNSITFASANCRYDLTLKEEATSSWWWGWGWWGWWWGWGWWWDKTTPETTNPETTDNTIADTDNVETNWEDTNNNSQNNSNKNDNHSRYQEWNQSETLSNWYTREFNNSYTFAYKNGITTMDDISKADMNWPLTRIAMAKMLSNYAINILWKKPDKTRTPHFKDVSDKLNADYNDWVNLAYQLWIMGIWIENFRPYDPVNRWEFGTALSRMLFGLADGQGAYYETHLQKLKELWIITNDNPNLSELRWYVMTMLMRSAM